MATTLFPARAASRPLAAPPGPWRRAGELPAVRWAVLATALFAAGGLTQLAGAPTPVWWAAYLACYAAGGWGPGLDGLRALRSRSLDVDLLMVVAALAAASIGHVLDGGLLIVIFATSGALEQVATARTRDSVNALLTLTPDTATRLRSDGAEERVEAEHLAVGDLVLVRPGERVGADGTVAAGVGEVDEATISGEPLPVGKRPGSAVFAGTLNGTGALTVRVDSPAAQSVIAHIAEQVQVASATKAAGQQLIERIESRYSVAMVTATAAILTIPLLAGAAFEPTLLRAMTFMIVASPCAIVLATMPPLLAAIATAGRHGVLVKSATVMERLGTVTAVALDKTGTLTEGTPQLLAHHRVAHSDLSAEDALALAAGAEAPSEHPLAGAIVTAARARGLSVPPATTFTALPGRGVRATVAGRAVTVGGPALLADVPARCSSEVAAAHAHVAAVEARARTAVIVLVDGTPAAVLEFTDQLRPAARDAVTALARLTGATPILLTGDRAAAASAPAAQAGIDVVHADLLPADKLTRIRELQQAGHRVLFVGDGVNDAPALAGADLGIAMGRIGSDLALESADAVIVRDDLAAVPAVIALSRRARRVVAANLAIAATVIVALSAWDLLGHLPLVLGVAGHEGSTILVALNGLRLLRSSAWPQRSTSERADAG